MEKIIVLFCILYFLFIMQLPVFANTVSTWAQLDARVTAGDSNIIFLNDITNAGESVINNSASTTAIDAKSYFISGNNTSQIFENDDKLSISNMTLKNGKASMGGAILNYGTLTVSDSTFKDNNVTSAGGGAIYSQYGSLTVSNSDFDNNTAARNGGAIRFVNITGSVSNSTFTNNYANNVGGAISSSGKLTITDCSFSDNESHSIDHLGVTGGGGGAILVESPSGNTIISNSTFSNNKAYQGSTAPTGGYGGAIYFGGGNNGSGTLYTMSIIADNGDTTFSNNSDDKNGSNDIYLAKGFQSNGDIATLNLNAGNGGEISFNSGIASDSTNNIININKSGIVGADGNNAPTDGTIEFNKSVSNSTINLYNGTMYLGIDNALNNDILSCNGGTIDMLNNATGTSALSSLNLATGTTTGIKIDADLAALSVDRLTATSVGSGTGKLNISDINLLNEGSYDVSLLFADSNFKNQVELTKTEILSPIYKYTVNYETSNGMLHFLSGGSNYKNYNPAILSSNISVLTGVYLSQLAVYNEALNHAEAYMSIPKNDRYARIASAEKQMVFSPLFIPEKYSGIWFKQYTSLEKVPLSDGPNVSNNGYGFIVGADSKLKRLKHGYDGVLTPYFGYNGSHQYYDNVGIYQNGGVLGVTGALYKKNFFTALTANAGGSSGEAKTMYGIDNFNTLVTGTALKSGYNIEKLNGQIIIQPSFLTSYTFANTFNYETASGVNMTSDPLNVLQLSPGLKLISNLKNGWQSYLTTNMVWNLMDKQKFKANYAALPLMSIDPYVEYGAGIQRRWGNEFTGFAQTIIRNGGRNGISLQFGLRWNI